jgi:predicted PurR-regulated permease PerM
MLYFLRAILIPLVLAGVVAVLVNGLMRFIGGRSRRAPHGAIVALTALIVIVSVVGATLIVAKGMVQVVQQVPALLALIDQLVQQAGYALRLREALTLQSLIGDLDVPRLVGRVAGSAGNLFSGLVLLVTFFGFIVAGRRRTSRKIERLAGTADASASVEADLRQIAATVETYVWVQTVTGLMVAAASGVVMLAAGLDNVLFWTVVVFLLCYIPVIGSTAGSILPALFALLQFPTWWQAAVIFGGTQVAATIVGNVIYPRMQAETQNIDPLTTLVALGFWSILWGLAGAFLAVPLTLIGMMVCVRVPGARWVAVLLSNDGNPTFPEGPARGVK